MSNKDAPPDDFKQTEIGLLSEEWEITELGDVCQHRRELVEPEKNGVTRYVGLEHIDSGSPKLQRYGSDSEVRSSKSRFYAGDVLYGKLRPYLDKAVLAEWEGICSTDILVFKAFEERIIPEFLVHLLHTSNFLAHAINTTSGVNHPRTSWGDIKTFKFARPPLPEQRAIAHVLSKIQAAAQAQAAIAERARELKRALMAKLFTEGLRGEPLKETEIGPMPESWEVKRLKEICDKPQYGYTESAVFENVGPRFLRITDIQEQGVNWTTVPCCRVPDDKLDKYLLREGDILFARIGATTGKSYIIETCPQAIFASYLIRIRVKSSTHPKFLYYFFNTEAYWRQVNANKEANLKKGISGTVLANLLCPFPKHEEEQREIARVLQTVDSKIAAAERKRAGLEELFRAMLGELMTGRVRVKTLL
jgi:type I restriction enzyme S subunit